LSLESGNYVYVKVNYFLVGGFSVLLEYADAVSGCSLLYGYGDSFDNLVKMAEEFVWNFEYGLIMLVWDDEGVTFVEGSRVQEGDYFFVFVNEAGWGLFLSDFAKYARVMVRVGHRLNTISVLPSLRC
jgi:hypothetical protein